MFLGEDKERDKLLSRLIKENGDKTQINKIRNEKGEVTTDNTELQRIIRDYYEQIYVNKIDNLEEMNNSYKSLPSKTEPGRNKKYEQTNNKHRNSNCNKKSSNKQKPRTKGLHRWILPKI